jgi:hypothetical protein
MWIVGLILLLLVLGLRKFILAVICWFVIAYIGFLVATFCPILLVPVVGYGLLKYVGLL